MKRLHDIENCAWADPVPKTMTALRVHAHLPDFTGLRFETVAVPQPAAGEVLIRIRAASVGFPDLLMTRGEYQAKPDLPFIGGADVAGEVAALGAGVSHLGIGDPVIALKRGGGFAGFAAYPAEAVLRKPERLSFAEAAALGSAYLTAYVALVRRARIEPGEWLLVHGATGGVGLAAVDLAKALGARVIAAGSSPEKLVTLAKAYRPDILLDSSAGFRDRVKAVTQRGADVIFDPVGGAVFEESTRCIAFGGRLLVVGFASGRIPSIAANIPLIKGFSVVGVRAGEYGRRLPEQGCENLDAIFSMAAEGRIHPHVHAELPLHRWREAFAMLEGRRVVGRVVLIPETVA